MSRRRRDRPPAAPAPATFPWPWAVFAASLAVRLLYWRATADSSWPHTAAFKGDAILWLEYARSLRTGIPFELGLPIHPPGTAYLVAALWNGSGGVGLVKAVWCVLGAAAAGLCCAAMTRAFGATAGAIAGTILAASSGLLLLSASLNGETPYLALVALAFWLLPDPDTATPSRLAGWAAVNAVACLFRVEHVLFAVLALLVIGARVARVRSPRQALVAIGVAAASFAAPLAPWHRSAWRGIEAFNERPAETPPPVRGLLDQLAAIRWDPAARARLDALPAFARVHSEAFVTATVAYRGGDRVRDRDFEILREAFGTEPRRLRAHPFVSLYGPLNLALASHPAASVGFGHAALDAPPPLAGGPAAYPAMLVGGLPPRDLAFIYPPHLALVNDGQAMALRWLAADPGLAARRATGRLARFWAGAATGVTGYAIPSGLSGIRYAVDITVADGIIPAAWRILVLLVVLCGLAAGWRRPALLPWLLFFGVKAAAAVMFFGYARLGATAIPVVALLIALAAERWWPAGTRPRIEPALRIALAAFVAVEAARWVQRPGLALDGDPAGPQDPVARSDHADHRLKVD